MSVNLWGNELNVQLKSVPIEEYVDQIVNTLPKPVNTPSRFTKNNSFGFSQAAKKKEQITKNENGVLTQEQIDEIPKNERFEYALNQFKETLQRNSYVELEFGHPKVNLAKTLFNREPENYIYRSFKRYGKEYVEMYPKPTERKTSFDMAVEYFADDVDKEGQIQYPFGHERIRLMRALAERYPDQYVYKTFWSGNKQWGEISVA